MSTRWVRRLDDTLNWIFHPLQSLQRVFDDLEAEVDTALSFWEANTG